MTPENRFLARVASNTPPMQNRFLAAVQQPDDERARQEADNRMKFDFERQAVRGLAEAGLATAGGLANIGSWAAGKVGATGLSDLLERGGGAVDEARQDVREFYGDPVSGFGVGGGIAGRVVGEGAQFMVPGVVAGRVAGGLAKVAPASRAAQIATKIAAPATVRGQLAREFGFGAPIDATIAAAGPEESTAAGLSSLLESRAPGASAVLSDISEDPLKRVLFEVGLGGTVGAGMTAAAAGARAVRGSAKEATKGLARRIAEVADPEAFTDPTTGLRNQTTFNRARPKIDENPDLEVLTFDAVGLKAHNDALGQEAGDAFLARIGQTIKETAEGAGVDARDLFRSGGDEFAVVVPKGQADALGQAIKQAIGETPIGETGRVAAVRYGVGDTYSSAAEAAQAAKKLEPASYARYGAEAAPEPKPGAPNRFLAPKDEAEGGFAVLPTKAEVEALPVRAPEAPEVEAPAPKPEYEIPKEFAPIEPPAPPKVEVPEAPAPEPRIVSLRKAEGADIRARLELDALDPPTRQSFQDSWDEALDTNLKDSALDIARSASSARRPLTAVEHTAAVQKYVELERELTDSRELLAEATRTGNETIATREAARTDRILSDIDALTEATDRTGTEAGRALSIRKLRANADDFTLARGLQLARAKKGAGLTQPEIKQVERQTERVSKLEAQVQKLEAENTKLQTQRRKRVAEAVVNVEAAQSVRAPRNRIAKLEAERGELLTKLSELGVRLNDITGVSAEGLHLLGRLATNHIRVKAAVRGGKVTLDEVVQDVLRELNNPDITPRDIYEALNARDPKLVGRQRGVVAKQVQELKTQARLLTQIEDAEKGIFDPSRPQARRSSEVEKLQTTLRKLRYAAYNSGMDSRRIERAVAQINDLQDQLANHHRALRRGQVEPTPELAGLQQKIAALRQEMRVEDTLSDLQEQLRTGEFKIPEKQQAPVISPSLEKKQIELRKARQEWHRAIEATAPRTGRTSLGEVAAFGRAIKATADMSATLRQGLWVSARRPVLASKSFERSAHAFFNEHTADQIENAIRQHPNQLLREKSGLALTEHAGSLKDREEHFMSSAAEKIPGFGAVVRASNRSMTTTLNLLRVGAFDKFVADFPNATTDELKAWADWVNVATGRGSLGKLAAVAKELSLVIFAPRFAASRAQTPFMLLKYWKQPRVRKEIAKDYAAVAGLGLTALGLAHAAGLEVGFDPREADWGKIRVGDTRIDLWAGVQQPMRVLARIALGATDQVGLTGAHLTDTQKEIDPLELLARFVGYKFSPAVTVPRELYRGKTAVGEDVTPSETAVKAVLPLLFEDIYESYKQSGPGMAALTGGLQFFGVGAQTYGDNASKVRRDVMKLLYEGKDNEAQARIREWNEDAEQPIRSVGGTRFEDAATTRRPTRPRR